MLKVCSQFFYSEVFVLFTTHAWPYLFEPESEGPPFSHHQNCNSKNQIREAIDHHQNALNVCSKLGAVLQAVQTEYSLYNLVSKENYKAHANKKGWILKQIFFCKQQVVYSPDAEKDNKKCINGIEIKAVPLAKCTAPKIIDCPTSDKHCTNQINTFLLILKYPKPGKKP